MPIFAGRAALAAEAGSPTNWSNVPRRIDPATQTRPRVDVDAGITVTFQRPVRVDRDGRIVSGDWQVRLAGVRLIERTRMCVDGEGRRWACGGRAQMYLLALVGGRTARCLAPAGSPALAEAAGGEIVADCRLGGQSIGLKLVREGFAEAADPAGALAEAEAAARRDGAGVWGPSAR